MADPEQDSQTASDAQWMAAFNITDEMDNLIEKLKQNSSSSCIEDVTTQATLYI